MTWEQWYDESLDLLRKEYGDREARSLLRILKEDFNITDFELHDSDLQLLKTSIGRLLMNEPVQFITGKTFFLGIELEVNNEVLIPRPETEELAWMGIEFLKERKFSNPKVLDIGTGSGAISLAIKANVSESRVTAIDISAGALHLARKNAEKNGLDIEWKQIDFLTESCLPDNGSWNLIISNPPYIPNSESYLVSGNALHYEPHIALFTNDQDGMEFYRAIAAYGREYLQPDGIILVEINEFRSSETEAIFREHFFQTKVHKDLSGKSRMISAFF